MAKFDESDQIEVKPSFSLKYISLATVVGLLPVLIGGVVGWGANEYFRDRKVIEVVSSSSSNLASIAPSVASKLDIQYKLNETDREPIRSLFRYDVTLSNRSGEGVESLPVVLLPPEGIELIPSAPSISTDPAELAATLSIKTVDLSPSKQAFLIGLLNTRQSVTVSLHGVSKQPVDIAAPVVAIAQKKDWVQKTILNNQAIDTHKAIARFFLLKWNEMRLAEILFLIVFSQFLFHFVRFYFKVAMRASFAITSIIFGRREDREFWTKDLLD